MNLVSLFFFFFKQKTAYEIMPSLVGSEMCIRDRSSPVPVVKHHLGFCVVDSYDRIFKGAFCRHCPQPDHPCRRFLTAAHYRAQVFFVIPVNRSDDVRAVVKRDMWPDLQCLFHTIVAVSYTHLRAHETRHDLVCRLLLE